VTPCAHEEDSSQAAAGIFDLDSLVWPNKNPSSRVAGSKVLQEDEGIRARTIPSVIATENAHRSGKLLEFR
jgi:hypothetical protein